MANTLYDNLVEQLDAAAANEPLMLAMDAKLHNASVQTNYDSWVESSLEFLRDAESLFIKVDPENG